MQQNSCYKNFDILQKIGEGSFGIIYKVRRNLDGKEYALKKVKIGVMNEKDRENALNEIRILASLDDQFIIGYKQTFFEESTQTLCIIMEYASGGDLLRFINQHRKKNKLIQESQIWKALIHITLGLKTLHEKKILHRDLKSANVFIDSNKNYKLGDLNVSKVLKTALARTQTGTPYYASPEVWRDQPYDMKSDMWSLGCIIYQMATFRPPFQGHDLQSLYRKVQICKYSRIPNCYSNDLWNVINLLLCAKPSKRLSAVELLKNQYIRKHGDISLELLGEPNSTKLLQTIKYQRNFRLLHDQLPKPNYQQDDIKIDKDMIIRKRILSASNLRRNSVSSVKQARQEIKDKINNSNQNKPNIKVMLPPKPQSKNPNIPILKTPEIHRKQLQILRQRSNSRNRVRLPMIIQRKRGIRASSLNDNTE